MKIMKILLANLSAIGIASGASAAVPSGDQMMPVDVKWAEVEKAGSVEAYTEFLLEFPESKYTSIAQERIRQNATDGIDAVALYGLKMPRSTSSLLEGQGVIFVAS